MTLIAASLIFAAAMTGSALIAFFALKAGLMDTPIMRSSHAAATPKAGGLGFLAGLGAASLALASLGAPPGVAMALPAMLAVSAAAASLGLLDDLLNLGAGLKLALLTALAFLASYVFGPVPYLPLMADLALPLPFIVSLLGGALWFFVVVNAVNFMDGADGLAAGSSLAAAAGLALAASTLGDSSAALLMLALAGVLAGFLPFNTPPARLFMGNVGSLTVGAVLAVAGLMLAQAEGGGIYLVPLVLAPLITDVLLTLGFRLKNRRLLLQGHREHVYQLLIRTGFRHRHVAALYAGGTGVCAALAALIAQRGARPEEALLGLVIAVAAWTGVVIWARRRAAAAGLD